MSLLELELLSNKTNFLRRFLLGINRFINGQKYAVKLSFRGRKKTLYCEHAIGIYSLDAYISTNNSVHLFCYHDNSEGNVSVTTVACFICYMFYFLLILYFTYFIFYLFYLLHILFVTYFICYMFYLLDVLFVTCFICYMFYCYMVYLSQGLFITGFICYMFYSLHVLFVRWFICSCLICYMLHLLNVTLVTVLPFSKISEGNVLVIIQ